MENQKTIDSKIIDDIDYENGNAIVKLNVDKLDDVDGLKGLGTGLFSKILPELGVESVKIGNKEFTVDLNSENFNLNEMVSAALAAVDETNTIKYSAKIANNGIEFEENFEIKFELTGSKQTKEKNQEILERNIKELEDTAIRLLNQQGRFNLEKESENEINFTFLTNGNPGFFGIVHDKSPATRETSMTNYTRGSGLATVLGQKLDESGKKQKERIEKIKPLLDLETMTIDGEKFDGLYGMSQIYKMKVGDFLGTKTLKVKVKDIVSGNEYIEYAVNFKLPNEINKDESQLKSELNAKTEVKSEAPIVEKAEVAEEVTEEAPTVEAEAEEVETEVK